MSGEELRAALDAWEKNGAPNRGSLAAFGIRPTLAAPSTPEPSGEVERLRQQNHDAAVRHDREVAELRSKVARYENAFQRARELVRGSPVDWTDDPPSKEPDGWWRYTSQQNREVIAAAVLRAAPSTEPALDPDTLVVAMLEAVKGVALRHGINPTEFLEAADAAANAVRRLAESQPSEETR